MGTKLVLEARPRVAAQKSQLHHDKEYAKLETIYRAPLPQLMFPTHIIHGANRSADRVQGRRLISNMVPRG